MELDGAGGEDGLLAIPIIFEWGVPDNKLAVQEDVDVVALSVLSGAHMTLFPRVLDLLREEGAGHVLLTGGGIIPGDDMKALSKLGVGQLFGPGTATPEAVAYVRDWFATREEMT